ncbi:MAG: NAD-binding protein [Pirellulales bacterium]|nr:NAD-binding protein [Pirellulales bacterium]
MAEGNTLLEIAAILSLATIVGIIGQKLRQPLIIMFLATGILAGPSWLGIIQNYQQIELLAHIGIALLLFIVGLKLDLHLIRSTGRVALATGLGLGNYGSGLAENLLRRNKVILGIDFDPAALDRWRGRGLSVLYGDIADPEIHVHLPIHHARWVISTVRSKEMNLALVHSVRKEGYDCKLALTATNEEEAEEFKKEGAHLIFRPFVDAAEQAADALTDAIDFLPKNIDWPIEFLEVRIRSDATVAGQTIRDIPVRTLTGVSILAVSRGGHVYYDPEPDFRIFPGDRLLIMGPPDGLKDAESVLNQLQIRKDAEEGDPFEIAEIRIAADSKFSGQSLADLFFRQKYGVTLVGIQRGKDQITSINPATRLLAGDSLVVIGTTSAVRNIINMEPL